jgi:LPXTG-site transpeptidase (sortase) family protein
MKTSKLFFLGGAALLLVAVVVFIWNAVPSISSRLYTKSIPTAPPLLLPLADSGIGSTPGAGELPLLPFESAEIVATKTAEVMISPTSTATLPAEAPTPYQPLPTPASVEPTAQVPPVGIEPAYMRIPILGLTAPVIPIGLKNITVNGTSALMWDVPDYRAAGWHETSARLGVPGNTVLNGHNTSSGEVFRDLYKIPVGALVMVESENGEEFAYRVKEKYILPEAGQPLEVRLKNALYVQETQDERLTLVTCHPYGSLANRLIVIAVPDLPSPQRGE